MPWYCFDCKHQFTRPEIIDVKDTGIKVNQCPSCHSSDIDYDKFDDEEAHNPQGVA